MPAKKTTIIITGLLLAANAWSATHYVVPPGTAGVAPAEPYTSWATAGTNIIEVVNIARDNAAPRTVWVTNGIYYPTNQIVVVNEMQLKSVNGYTNTILNGASASTNRCVNLNNSDGIGKESLFQGFTVTNYTGIVDYFSGTVYGYNAKIFDCLITGNRVNYSGLGGAYAAGIYALQNVVISNCTVRGNYAVRSIGGVSMGSYCQLLDSVIEGNRAGSYYGGGVAMSGGSDILVSNCYIINNKFTGSHEAGGGGITCYVYESLRNKIVSCVITGNTSTTYGGGVRIYANGKGEFINCTITGNSAARNGGGAYADRWLTLRNCLVAQNTAATNGGGVYLTTSTNTVESCTIVSNYAVISGGGLYLADSGSATNNIIYHNTAGVSAANFANTAGNTGLDYSCVFPAVNGAGNTTNDPRLANLNGGNYRLGKDSPCINTGTNLDWMTTASDLDGRMRKRYGIVDMGAYEKVYEGSIYTGY